MKYVSNDGKIFETIEECEKHEAEVNEFANKKKALEDEIDRKWAELLALSDKYNDLIERKQKEQRRCQAPGRPELDNLDVFLNHLLYSDLIRR